MSKITLIGIDTAKNVFHLVGIDKCGNYAYRKKLGRLQRLPPSCHHAGPRRQRDCLTEGMSPTRPLACCSRPGSGRAFFAPGVGIGVKQRCIRAEFSPRHSKMARLHSDLAEDLI
jgi:hypothetical protein